VTDTLTWKTTIDKEHDTVGFSFEFHFFGQGTFYLSDVELHHKQ
jgi:hypothetical protein